MLKSLAGIAFSLAAVFSGAALADTAKLKIGLSLPLSGNSALLGSQFLAGARLALGELAPDGGIEIVTADDQCDAKIAGLAALDLKSADVTLVTGFLCNESVRPAAAVFKERGIPLLVAGARSEQIIGDANKEEWNLFRIAPGDDRAAEATFRFLSERWRGVPWAIIDDGTVYGRTLADNLRAKMEEIGQPPQFADNFRPAQSTQAGLIRRLQRSGVSAAFIAGGAEDVSIIWSNVREFGARMEVAGGEALEALPWTDAAKTTPDGLLGVMLPDPATLPATAELTKRMTMAAIEPEPYAFSGYAAMQLALQALRPTGGETTQALKDTIFHTVLGNVRFDERGANRVDNYGLFVWRGGTFVSAGAPQQ